MNIEQLKAEWQQYDQKLALSVRLNEQFVLSMLKERSKSRIARIRRNNMICLLVMIINLVLLACIFAGNPFDFPYTWQYIPYSLLSVGILLVILSLFKSLRSFNVNLNNVSLDAFLRKAIAEYSRSKKIQMWCRIIIFSGGVLTIVSFLPGKLENKGLWPALGETAVVLAITLLLYFAAFKSGILKDRKKEEFENDLKEWGELKKIAAELKVS
jgi:hypothetical protein